jgi:hypothetical protein
MRKSDGPTVKTGCAGARCASARREARLRPLGFVLLAVAACTPSAPPLASDASTGQPRDGRGGPSAGTGAPAGGNGGAPVGGTGGGAGGSGGTPAIDSPPPRDARRAAADAAGGADAAAPPIDRRPPADAQPSGASDAPAPTPDAPPANPGSGCTPGGSGLDTSTPGVVLDRKTCLAWQRQDPERDVSRCPLMARFFASALCYDEAIKDCQALRLDGKSDWRLPTVAELSSLVVTTMSPAIDRAAFPEAVLSLYWSSQASGGKVTCVDFSNRGNVNPNIGPDGPQAFRCVRGPLAAP